VYLLASTEYDRARSILRALEIHFVVDAILEGRAEGKVYVDDPGHPGAALAQHHHRFYLAVETPEAGAALLRFWSDTLYPQSRAAGHEMYVLYASSERWTPLIVESLADRDPISAPRQYWALSTRAQSVPSPLPAGYQVVAIDQALLNRSDLLHLDELCEEIGSEHVSTEAFVARSFGVCALYEGREIGGWCLAEYGNAERCEVGIETLHPHRRRGLGTAMTVGLVEQARARGLAQVGWHSYTRNVPSIATARKAGLVKVCDYPAYIGHYDPVTHLCEQGYVALGQGRTEEGLDWMQQAFARGAAPGWAYYTAGCACVALGEHDRAFGYLDQAVKHGFVERALYEDDPDLYALHGRAEWVELLARLGELDAAE
jgi:GNAT superfamily N-acetyltransferase